jgi:hypothetical protein
MCSLCQYKTTLGEPRKGIHSYRLFGVAIIDVFMTILGAFILWLLLRGRIRFLKGTIGFFILLVSLFALGILLHRFFCVKTTVDKLLFPE